MAEESASIDDEEAALEVKLLEAQLRAIRARKRSEGSKDNNSHHGWGE